VLRICACVIKMCDESIYCSPAGVLLAAPAATRDAALEGLVRGAASHVDAVVRKTCMQVTPVSSQPAVVSEADLGIGPLASHSADDNCGLS